MTMNEAAQVAILTAGMSVALALTVDLWAARWRAGNWEHAVTIVNWQRWAPGLLSCIPIGAYAMHVLVYGRL